MVGESGPLELAEGQLGSATDALVYPNISTCLILTCVCGGSPIGGHAFLFPESQQKGIDAIVDYIALGSATKTRLYLIGELAIWTPDYFAAVSQDHTNLQSVIDALQPAVGNRVNDVHHVVRIDTGELTGGTASVGIEVSLAARTLTVWRKYQGARGAVLHSSFF